MSNFLINSYLSAAAVEGLLWENTATGSYDNFNFLSFANEFDTNDDVIGNTITKITCSMKKTSSPEGDITGHLWFGTNPNAPSVASAETYSANGDLTTSYADYDFTFTNTTACVQGHLAGMMTSELPSSGSVQIDRSGTAVDGTYNGYGNTTTWTYPASKTRCMTMKVYGL